MLIVLFVVFCGFYLLIGGVWLVVFGGFWYYFIVGLVMLGVIVMLFCGKCVVLWLYVVLLLVIMIWGVWEVGFDFWVLMLCSDIFVFFGIWLILFFVWCCLLVFFVGVVGVLVVVLLISGGMLIWVGFNDLQEVNGILSVDVMLVVLIFIVVDGDWLVYGCNQEGQCFFLLKQINVDNVKNLKEVWVFCIGDLKQLNDLGEIINEVMLIKVGDMFFLCIVYQCLFVLDVVIGKEKWYFDLQLNVDLLFQYVICCGVFYYEVKVDNVFVDVVVDCLCCIILLVNDGCLFVVNVDNGKLCEIFVNKGIFNLQINMLVIMLGMYEFILLLIIIDKIIVIVGVVIDNFFICELLGVICGFDVNIGKLLWVFDLGVKDLNVILSDEYYFMFNLLNLWVFVVYDVKLDLVYLLMGVIILDIWGGNCMLE